mmetsp:Transcript_20189/g.28395  ORF Transcript_20189/g.28395 Transcript_20189/m.28395 type:complete len:182 (+) Transcript_20189:2459-3004(+)
MPSINSLKQDCTIFSAIEFAPANQHTECIRKKISCNIFTQFPPSFTSLATTIKSLSCQSSIRQNEVSHSLLHATDPCLEYRKASRESAAFDGANCMVMASPLVIRILSVKAHLSFSSSTPRSSAALFSFLVSDISAISCPPSFSTALKFIWPKCHEEVDRKYGNYVHRMHENRVFPQLHAK